jgi:hypothetical protein
VRWPRIALAALGALATAAALAVGPPQVFTLTFPAGIAAFVIGAGCLAADLVPYRPAYAAAAALSIADAVLLAVGGRGLGVPALLPAMALVALQLAPAARARWISRHPGAGPSA